MKRSKSLTKVITLVLAVMLCLSCASMVLADTVPEAESAAITKKLQMPEGTTTPTATFTFTIVGTSLDGSTETADVALIPAILSGSTTLSFASTDAGATADGIKVVTKQTENLFPASITWPRAGIYAYTIKETADTWSATGESMTYSAAEYLVRVYVKNGTSGPEIDLITCAVVVVDNSTQTEGEKIDPTLPGSGHSNMVFTNTFIKNTDTGEGAVAPLAISKTVSGDYGDRSKPFAFSITATKTALETGSPVYKAYLMEGTSVVATITTATTATDNIETVAEGNDYIKFPTGTAVTVNLKHGQSLKFIDLPVGAKYTVTETAPGANYTASVSLVVNGAEPVVSNASDANTALTVPSTLIGDNANSAAFTNAFNDNSVTPTGIVVENLPFILIIALAVIALVVFIVAKSRKRTDSSK